MNEYEVAAENGHRVRVEATDDQDAFEKAIEADPDIETGSVYRALGLPVGWDGGDAEDATAQGESVDNGDFL